MFPPAGHCDTYTVSEFRWARELFVWYSNSCNFSCHVCRDWNVSLMCWFSKYLDCKSRNLHFKQAIGHLKLKLQFWTFSESAKVVFKKNSKWGEIQNPKMSNYCFKNLLWFRSSPCFVSEKKTCISRVLTRNQHIFFYHRWPCGFLNLFLCWIHLDVYSSDMS